MNKIILFLIVGAVVAAPCIYGAFSTEPSPLAGAFALAAGSL